MAVDSTEDGIPDSFVRDGALFKLVKKLCSFLLPEQFAFDLDVCGSIGR